MSARPTQELKHSRKSTHMYMDESLVRAQVRERLEQARQRRLAHKLAAARRLSRKAERAAAQARLALARSL